MYRDIIEARYTNDQQDTILVLHSTEEDGIIEEYIQPDTVQYKALVDLGWSEEKIVDTTAEFKRQQMASVVEVAKTAAADLYKEEVERCREEAERYQAEADRSQRHSLEARAHAERERERMEDWKKKAIAAQLHTENVIKELQKKVVMHESLSKKRDGQINDQITKINSFLTSGVSTEDMEKSLTDIVDFLTVINTEEKAVEMLKKITDKKTTAKTVVGVLNKII
jgi:hypothetical protein